MSAAVEIPQEVAEQVIDFLHNNPQALKACSLVCRAWVPRCRSYLFETCNLVPKSIRVFSEFLVSPNCTFLHHIRTITASRRRWHPHDHYFDTLAPELRRLAGVHAFETKLNTIGDATTVDSISLLPFTAAFAHVTRLVIVCNFDQPAPLLNVISHFAALQHLCLRRDLVNQGFRVIMAASSNVVPPTGLSSLTFNVDVVDPILTWFRASNNLHHVQSLVLPDGHIDQRSSDAFGQALPLMGNLHHLSISLSAFKHFIPDFSAHVNLRTLIMRDCMWDNAKLISKLVAPRLEHLTIEFYSRYAVVERHARRDWPALDVHLGAANFSRLLKVLFRCKIREHARFLKENFVSLRAANILQVEPDPEDLSAVGFLEALPPPPPPPSLLPLPGPHHHPSLMG